MPEHGEAGTKRQWDEMHRWAQGIRVLGMLGRPELGHAALRMPTPRASGRSVTVGGSWAWTSRARPWWWLVEAAAVAKGKGTEKNNTGAQEWEWGFVQEGAARPPQAGRANLLLVRPRPRPLRANAGLRNKAWLDCSACGHWAKPATAQGEEAGGSGWSQAPAPAAAATLLGIRTAPAGARLTSLGQSKGISAPPAKAAIAGVRGQPGEMPQPPLHLSAAPTAGTAHAPCFPAKWPHCAPLVWACAPGCELQLAGPNAFPCGSLRK